MAVTTSPSSLIDLDRHPIGSLNSAAGQRLVADAKRQLDESGLCLLDGFLRAEAVEAIVSECESLRAKAFFKDKAFPHYPPDNIDPLPENHSFRVLRRTTAVAVTIIADGEEHGRHFDGNDWVVSLLLQQPASGGEFEFVPMIRSAEDENYGDVERLLQGEVEDRVVRVAQSAGMFSLFKGRHSIHRVKPVRGSRERLIALLSYDTGDDLPRGNSTKQLGKDRECLRRFRPSI